MSAYRDLRALSDDDLIARYDHAMGTTHAGLEYYRDELLRRETAGAARELIRLTRGLWLLTVSVALAAIVALVIALRRPLCSSARSSAGAGGCIYVQADAGFPE